jgi:hypothetical protein
LEQKVLEDGSSSRVPAQRVQSLNKNSWYCQNQPTTHPPTHPNKKTLTNKNKKRKENKNHT